MDKIRLFVAVDIPGELRDAIGREMERFGRIEGVKWVRPSQVHLTLKFLGNMDADNLPLLSERLWRAAAAHPPLCLRLSGSGAFPSIRKARVLWLGCTGDLQAVSSLAEDIDKKAARLGVRREERRLKPHLTLARCRDPRDLQEIVEGWGNWLTGLGEPSFRVDRFILYRSILNPAGAEYIKIEEFPLTGGEVA